MTTYAELKRHALLLVDDVIQEVDPLVGTDYNENMLNYATRAAFDAILPKVWKPSTDTVLASVTEHTLPSDVYEVQGILDISNGELLPSFILSANSDYGSDTTGNRWILYPEGTVTFSNELGSSGGILYYAATWALPSSDSEDIEPPEYAVSAIVLYMASHLLLSAASSAGGLAQYKTKAEAGDPEDNPLEKLSNLFLKRFDIELARLPMKEKGIQ